ncbi:hypothetical protein Tco_0826287 [Tanacetum coccineum]
MGISSIINLKLVKNTHEEDYQEYGLAIPDVMLNDAIKQSESYQMFIKYSTGLILPKNSRGKESEPEPEPVKRKTASRRVVKKIVTISTDDNIISNDPDVALELGKSISKTEVEEAKVARQVHATHGVPSLTLEEQEAADTMQAPKESKKTNKRQPGTRGSNEGTGTIPGVPDESTFVSATSSEGTSTKPGVPDEEKKDDKEGNADDEGDDHISDTQDTDDEYDETESDEDEMYKYKIRVRKDEDEEMLNAEVEYSGKGDVEVSDAAKADTKKTEEAKDDSKKAELPLTSSSLSISSGFGDQFLKLSSDTSLVSTIKDTTNIEISSLLDIKIQYEVPHIHSPSVLRVPVFMIYEPTVLTLVQETPSASPVTILPPLSVSTTPPLKVAKLEKDMSKLKKIDLSAKALAALKTQVPYQIPKLPKKQTPTVDLEQESKKFSLEILMIKKEQAEKQKMPKFTIKSTKKAALKEFNQKSTLYQTMHANKSFNINPANHRLYHALMEALIEDENAIDKGVADIVKDHKRKHDDDKDDDDENPLAGPNQGKKTKRRRTKESESSSTTKETPKDKALTKGFKTSKSTSTKEPVEEPTAEVVMDDAGKDVVSDDDQPQDNSGPKTAKTPNPEWFTQPPRPPTPDPEWNKRQVVLDQPE